MRAGTKLKGFIGCLNFGLGFESLGFQIHQTDMTGCRLERFWISGFVAVKSFSAGRGVVLKARSL